MEEWASAEAPEWVRWRMVPESSVLSDWKNQAIRKTKVYSPGEIALCNGDQKKVNYLNEIIRLNESTKEP